METTLTWIHDFLDVILSNFNMAWLLLIVIIVYHKQILNLLERVTRIGFKDAYVKFDPKQLSKDIGETVERYDAEDKEIPPVGAGGGGPSETLTASSTDDEMMRLLTSNNLLIGYYLENGENLTISRMYKFLEEKLEMKYSIDFKNIKEAERTIKNEDPDLHAIFRKLRTFYALTLGDDTEELWKLKDIINYSTLVKIALNRMER